MERKFKLTIVFEHSYEQTDWSISEVEQDLLTFLHEYPDDFFALASIKTEEIE